jgi:imidazolonepropionase-like amidohydrolase
MRRDALLLLLAAAPAVVVAQSRDLAITGVTVIPMSGPVAIPNATVVVRDGRITEVATGRNPSLPAGITRVDGRGKFLIPGLADMHAHLYADEWVADSVAPHELGVYLAHGVTTARLMIGTPLHLVLRRDVREGRLLGPTLFVASPHLTGDGGKNSLLVRSPEEARAAVRTAADAGYDFIKLTTNITPEVFDAVVAEARNRGIRVVGHVDPRVTVARALAAGQQIEHLDNYMESVLADSAPSRVSVSDYGVGRLANWQSLHHVDMTKVEAIAGATARAGVFVTPTLGFFANTYATRYDSAAATLRPDFAHIPPAMRALYQRALRRFWSNPPSDELLAKYKAVRNRMVRAIVDSGGKIMAGSDGPGGLQGYGWMMHRELEALVAAGLTPHEALAAATVVPAEYLRTSETAGTITVGKRADLVLLDANPLDDIRHTTRIHGVVVGGTWLDRARLDRLIADAGARLNP